MKLLLTGVTGQVGWELRRTLTTLGTVHAPSRTQLDLADPQGLVEAIRSSEPDVIVNAAAHTAVDRAEEDPEAARAINGRAPGILADEAARAGAILVHYSTDYVFDGETSAPYTEVDDPSPINVYGRTKLAGEEAVRASGAEHLIFRTSWVYGLRRKNFVTRMLTLFRERENVSVVEDQKGSPTWCRFLAGATAQVLARHLRLGSDDPLGGRGGTYHLAGAGSTSWYGFARAIRSEMTGRDGEDEFSVREIRPVTGSEFSRAARRPRNSTLSSGKAQRELRLHVPSWEEQLSLCLHKLGAPTSRSAGS